MMTRRQFVAGLGTAASGQFLIDSQSLLAAQTAESKALNLRITGLKTFIVNVGSVHWVFCKVYTNQGLTGLGEGSITSKEATLTQAIMEHERFLMGKDPTDIEILWQGMFRYPRWRGGKKIGAIAKSYRIEMAPHNPQSEVSTLASLHVDATTPACAIQEYNPRNEQWVQDLFYGGAVKVKDGYADLPDRPGLGVDLDEKVAAKYPYKPVNRPKYVFSDGGVADH